jgi:hypothetical protein
VQLRVGIAGEHDQAHVGAFAPEARDDGDPVEQRHVQVDDDGVGVELLGQLDRLQPVSGSGDDRQLGLSVDQRSERLEEELVVVRQQDRDQAFGHTKFP